MRGFFNQPPRHPQLQKYSYAQLIEHLTTRNGGLKAFLVLVPSQKLTQAIEQQQFRQDERVRVRRQANLDAMYRQNVASFTVGQLTRRCINEGVSLFGHLNYYGVVSLKKHATFGMQLVNMKPEKYYVGLSKHQTHSQRLNEMYSEWNNLGGANQPNSDSDDESQPQQPEQQKANRENDQQEQQQLGDSEQNSEDFIVDSSEQQDQSKSYMDQKEELQILKKQVMSKKQTKNAKKVVKSKKNQKTTQKLYNEDSDDDDKIAEKYLL